MSSPLPLLIFPFNGNGIEALDCLGSRHTLVAFIDDTPGKQGLDAEGRLVGPRHLLQQHADAEVLAVPGGPTTFRTRRLTIESLGIDARRFATVIHPSAQVSSRARIGRNVLIMAGVVITSNATIGDHVCILPNTVIHHDACIGDWSLIGANVTVAGHTHVGDSCYVGSGSSLKNGIQLGAGTLVGLGSTVLRDTSEGTTVAGSPARLLR